MRVELQGGEDLREIPFWKVFGDGSNAEKRPVPEQYDQSIIKKW